MILLLYLVNNLINIEISEGRNDEEEFYFI